LSFYLDRPKITLTSFRSKNVYFLSLTIQQTVGTNIPLDEV